MSFELAINLILSYVSFALVALTCFFIAKVIQVVTRAPESRTPRVGDRPRSRWSRWSLARNVKKVVRQKPCGSFERTMAGIGLSLQAEDVSSGLSEGFQIIRGRN